MIHRQCARYRKSGLVGLNFSLDKSEAGFTLVETIIYIALTSFILSSILASIYPIFTSIDRISLNITREGESLFVLRKVAWSLSQAASAVISGGDTLTVETLGGETIVIAPNGEFVELSENGGTFLPLNATRARITNFSLIDVPIAGDGTPRYIELSFEVNGVMVGPVKHYVHF